MMNEARVSVGAGAVALGYTGYLHALDYARVRTQGRPLQDKDPAAPPVALTEHPDVRRMLLAQKSYVEGGLALVLFCARLVDESRTAPDPRRRAGGRAAAGPADPDRQVLALPVVPGRQRPRDPGARRLRLHPRLPRRAVLPGQPAQPDPRGHARHPGARPARPQGRRGRRCRAAACWATGSARRPGPPTAAGGDAASYAAQLDRAWDDVLRVTGALWAKGDPALALANATLYLEALGHVVVAWLWLEQLLAVGGEERRVLRRQAGGGPLLLRLRAAEDRAPARPAGVAGHHHARPGPRRPLTRRGEWPMPAAPRPDFVQPAATTRHPCSQGPPTSCGAGPSGSR